MSTDVSTTRLASHERSTESLVLEAAACLQLEGDKAGAEFLVNKFGELQASKAGFLATCESLVDEQGRVRIPLCILRGIVEGMPSNSASVPHESVVREACLDAITASKSKAS